MMMMMMMMMKCVSVAHAALLFKYSTPGYPEMFLAPNTNRIAFSRYKNPFLQHATCKISFQYHKGTN